MNEYEQMIHEEKSRRWNRLCWAIVGVFALVAALFISQQVNAPEADAYYNKVINQTNSAISVQWTNGYWVGVNDYTYDVRQVYIPYGRNFRFIGPGVNSCYRTYLSGLYKTVGPGTWFVQNC